MLTRIVFINVDTRRLTLYREDGTTLDIPQGDPRVATIIEQAMPALNAGKVAEIDLSQPNSYEEFEQKSSGLVRFFKVAKKKLSGLFGGEAVEPVPSGTYGPGTPVPNTAQQVDEVLQHAVPTTGEKLSTLEPETIIAVVEDKIVPGVEKLHEHVKHAAKLGSTKGMEMLISRLSKIIDKRQHSVEDILRFMEKGDLPVADDGTIIAYKILKNGEKPGTFVDCHTGRVPQRVGSEVRVAESLVDRNRRNECSNGLHIARRGYLGQFTGSVCFLVKIAPEDVVTVPHNDPNKVRVCAYHIIEQLTPEAFATVRSNKPMTESADCRAMLARAISGDHIGIIERVTITQQMGGGIQIEHLDADAPPSPATRTTTPEVKNAIALDDPEIVEEAKQAPTVDPKTLVQNQEKEAPVNVVSKHKVSRKELAAMITARLMSIDTPLEQRRLAATDLKAYKQKVKLGWDVLGVTPEQLKMMEQMLVDAPKVVKGSKKTQELTKKLRKG